MDILVAQELIETAEKILDEPPYWNKVVAAYNKAGLSEEVALKTQD